MRKLFLSILFVCFGLLLWGQQVITIDNTGAGDYTDFTTAAEYLNGLSEMPDGGVEVNVVAGQIFPEGQVVLTAVATEANPIIFQRSGDGENPVLNNNDNFEVFIEFNAASWITFDGIDLVDPIADDTLRYEKGYYIFASDHVSILNSNIVNFDKYGIHVRDASTNTIIDKNELFFTSNFYTSQATVYGIYVQFNADADNAVISNNKLYGIKEASATIYGIRVWKVGSQIYNNFISFTDDNNDKIYALRMDGGLIGLEMDIQYNTVLLSGVATDKSYCFYRTGTDGLMNVQNNIMINNRSGDFDHFVYDYTFASGDWNADYNCYYTENGRLGDWGDTECTSLEDWQTASAGDANSIFKSVEFIDNYNLHLAGTSLGDTDLTGTPLAAITTDIDGEARNAGFPYMGADENLENPLVPVLDNEYVIDNSGAGDFTNFADAINLLNIADIPEGGVTFNVTAGQTFTEDYLYITAVGTETSPIVFQTTGDGENPIINNGSNLEYFMHMEDAAWITFDGIDLVDQIADDTLRYEYGYYIYACDNITIKNSRVVDFDKYGIYVRSASTNSLIENNQIYYTEDYYTTQTSIYGIKVNYSADAQDAIVRNNRIWGFKTASSGAYGIDFNQVTGMVYNNFVSITADDNDKVYGMKLTGRTDRSIEVYHNTVYVEGTATDEGYGLALFGGGGDLIVRNNIVVNNRADTLQYNIYIGITYPGMLLDNNLYYNGLEEGFRGRLQSNYTTDHNEWVDWIGMDSLSTIYNVEFADEMNGDLHIAGSSLGLSELATISLGIPEDIDYETRPEENLYYGADENLEYPIITEMESEYVIDNSGAGDFISFNEAAEVLNNYDVPAGGTIFNVVAGQLFTEDPIVLTAMGTESNPVTFQKTGGGENPVISNNGNIENMIEFNEAAWITFDSIDIMDQVAGDTLRFEKAIYINASDHISYLNCKIYDFDKYGIHVRYASTNTTIHNNVLAYTEAYETTQSTVYGIYVAFNSDADNAIVTNNVIRDIKYASSTIYGIRVSKVSSLVANNMISFPHNGNDKIYGLRLDAGDAELDIEAVYNSVYLGGTATDNGYCLYKTGTEGDLNLYNNIFINDRSGDVDHFVVDYTFVSGNWFADYNLYYSTNGRIGDWGDTECASFEEWQTASGGDSHGVSKMVEFVSGSDLHLTGESLGDFDLGGVPIEGITMDIDGDLRHEVNPYIGVDEDTDNPLNPESQYVISVSPLQLSFADIYVGTISDTSLVTIQNAGADSLTITGITSPAGFSISLDNENWSNSIDGFMMAVGETQQLSVLFQPEEVVAYQDSISIQSNAIDNEFVYVQLEGNSLQPGITVDPTSLNYDLTATEIITTSQMVTVYNTGTLPILIDTITISDNFAIKLDDVTFVTSIENVMLEDSLEYKIIFNPMETGTITGELEFYSAVAHGENSGEIVTLSGEAFDFNFEDQGLTFASLWLAEAVWGDIDQDGYLDIVASGYELNSDYSQLHVYMNNGDMTFTEMDHDMLGSGSGTIQLFDFDTDGDLDIFIMGQYEFEVYIAKTYQNNGGVFTEVENDILPLKSCNADWGDYDADGDYDLLVMGEEYIEDEENIAHVTLYENDGEGNFIEVYEIASMNTGEAKFGDYDNDGDLDVAVSGRLGSWNYNTQIYRNDDNTAFTPILEDGAEIRYTSVIWGDNDNDGDLDLLVTGSFDNEVDSELHIYRNDGDDIFVDVEHNIKGIRQGDAAWGDLDQDGDLDVIVNGIHNYTSWIGYIYLNEGNNEYTMVDSIVSLKYATLDLADADNDNDLDLFVTGRYDYMDYRVMLFENEIEFTNTTPEAPTIFTAEVVDNTVTLIWDAGTDLESGDGVSYNLRIGTEPGENDIMPANANSATGYREIASLGNVGQNLEIIIHTLPQGIYYASIQTIDGSFIGSAFTEEISFEITVTDSDEDLVPLITKLQGNYPNPFNPTTEINFSLKKDSNVTIDIYNMKGQKVKTLVQGELKADTYSIMWDGRDDNNSLVASGIYFYKMDAGSYKATKKMTLLK